MPGLSWTSEDKQRLAELVRAGHGPLSIHRQGVFEQEGHPVRTVNSIAQQIRRLHLAKPENSERARQAHMRGLSVSAEARQKATEFLRRNGADVPVDVVAEKFGVTISWVRRTLKAMGIRRSWSATVSHPLSKFHDPDYRAKVSARVKAWAKEKARQHEEELRSTREQILLNDPAHTTRCCEQCRENWPLLPEFFAATKQENTGKTYYLYTCRLCMAANRHTEMSNEHRDHPRTQRLRRYLVHRCDEVREQGTGMAEKRCIACWKDWPLTSEFWRTSKLKSGHLYFEPRCRLCQNTKRRHDEKARKSRTHWTH